MCDQTPAPDAANPSDPVQLAIRLQRLCEEYDPAVQAAVLTVACLIAFDSAIVGDGGSANATTDYFHAILKARQEARDAAAH